MIAWLKGTKIESWENGSRQGLVLSCSNVGYEVQVLPRELTILDKLDEIILWIHLVQRDEGDTLFGFLNKEDRNLFRSLILVNGVGPQIGISLLEAFKAEDLISAIINRDVTKLSKAQGIGKKTAERLSVELRNKLSDSSSSKVSHVRDNLSSAIQGKEEVKELWSTLQALGYEESEIQEAICAVQKEYCGNSTIAEEVIDLEAWLKSSLKWLSQEIA